MAAASKRILLVNEPLAYRETLAMALTTMCANADVTTADPENVEEALFMHRPHVVVCSELVPVIERHALNWVSLYPEGSSAAIQCAAGQRTLVHDVDLTKLARFIDRATEPSLRMHR